MLTTLSIIQAPWDSTKSQGLTKAWLHRPHTPSLPSEAWAGRATSPRSQVDIWPSPPLPPPNPHIPGPGSVIVLKSLGRTSGPRGAEALKAKMGPGARSYLRLAVLAGPRPSRYKPVRSRPPSRGTSYHGAETRLSRRDNDHLQCDLNLQTLPDVPTSSCGLKSFFGTR